MLEIRLENVWLDKVCRVCIVEAEVNILFVFCANKLVAINYVAFEKFPEITSTYHN